MANPNPTTTSAPTQPTTTQTSKFCAQAETLVNNFDDFAFAAPVTCAEAFTAILNKNRTVGSYCTSTASLRTACCHSCLSKC